MPVYIDNMEIWSDLTIAGWQTWKDRATQPMDHGRLRWAKNTVVYQNGQIWGMDKDNEKERRKCADQLENNQEEIILTEIDWFSALVLIDQKCFKADYYFNFSLHPVLSSIYLIHGTQNFNATPINYLFWARKKTSQYHICPIFLSYIIR